MPVPLVVEKQHHEQKIIGCGKAEQSHQPFGNPERPGDQQGKHQQNKEDYGGTINNGNTPTSILTLKMAVFGLGWLYRLVRRYHIHISKEFTSIGAEKRFHSCTSDVTRIYDIPIKKLGLGNSFIELPMRFSSVAWVKSRKKASNEYINGLAPKRFQKFYNELENIVIAFIYHRFLRMKEKREFKGQRIEQ